MFTVWSRTWFIFFILFFFPKSEYFYIFNGVYLQPHWPFTFLPLYWFLLTTFHARVPFQVYMGVVSFLHQNKLIYYLKKITKPTKISSLNKLHIFIFSLKWYAARAYEIRWWICHGFKQFCATTDPIAVGQKITPVLLTFCYCKLQVKCC